jgi:L-ribulokinase
MKTEKLVMGVDFGTDSVRALIVDSANGEEIASGVSEYTRWKQGLYCDPTKNQFRQHPLDYIESLEIAVKKCITRSPADTALKIRGLSIDTTGSTPVAVNQAGTPLALLEEFKENPNAMFVLWKDHTAVIEANEINLLATSWGGEDYTKYVGGVYSSEWFWAKILYILRRDEAVRKSAFSWVEHCDWIPGLLTGATDPLKLKRSRCAAGHKAMWHESFQGLPADNFLEILSPHLKGLRSRLYSETFTCDVPAGNLSPEWASRFGLSESVVVGAGAFDAHLGAIGAEIQPYMLSKVIGTSTCDMLVAPMEEMGEKLIKGICGQVDGSIIPGMLGMEAGQSAFGDIYAWFKQLLSWPLKVLIGESEEINTSQKEKLINEIADKLLPELSLSAQKCPIDESGVLSLDWMNGRRTPDANQMLKGAIAGLNLGSNAPLIFRSLVEATAFGAKKIVDRFLDEGVSIKGVIALGGVPKKSPFAMQVLADVLNIPIKVARSEQTVALGSAMAAATVAGIYPDIETSQKAMGNGFEIEYYPNADAAEQYQKIYEKYAQFGNLIETSEF